MPSKHTNPGSTLSCPWKFGAEWGRCGKLNFRLYGFLKAASAWHMEQRGVGWSVIFRHEAKDLVGVAHGDDFVFGGSDEDLMWVAMALAAKFVIYVKVMLGLKDEEGSMKCCHGDSCDGGAGELNGRPMSCTGSCCWRVSDQADMPRICQWMAVAEIGCRSLAKNKTRKYF